MLGREEALLAERKGESEEGGWKERGPPIRSRRPEVTNWLDR